LVALAVIISSVAYLWKTGPRRVLKVCCTGGSNLLTLVLALMLAAAVVAWCIVVGRVNGW
jgi:hypothetical protein